MPCRDHDCPAFEMIGWAVPPERCGVEGTIGMIDTAVNTRHAALAGQAVEIVSVMSEGEESSGAMHGTAIAALLVGAAGSRTPGLVPRASLVAVEAFHRDAAGDAADVYKIVRGLDALGERSVRIVNLSFAGPANAVLEHAVGRAIDGGMILVAAAGNAGPRAGPAFPGAFPGVIAVTAVDRDREPYRHAGRGGHIAFAAPGVGVWTAASIEGGRFRSGTSYAVPFVSAAAAATLARDPAASVAETLAAGSTDLGEAGRDPVFGWGLVTAPACGDGAAPM
jgi:subtilisin family serine protease